MRLLIQSNGVVKEDIHIASHIKHTAFSRRPRRNEPLTGGFRGQGSEVRAQRSQVTGHRSNGVMGDLLVVGLGSGGWRLMYL